MAAEPITPEARAAVESLLAFPPVDLTTHTFNQLYDELNKRLETIGASPLVEGAAKREFALAKTHLEDAVTRFNAGMYRAFDCFKRADSEELLGRLKTGRG